MIISRHFIPMKVLQKQGQHLMFHLLTLCEKNYLRSNDERYQNNKSNSPYSPANVCVIGRSKLFASFNNIKQITDAHFSLR